LRFLEITEECSIYDDLNENREIGRKLYNFNLIIKMSDKRLIIVYYDLVYNSNHLSLNKCKKSLLEHKEK
jgi:hypothetical protein